MVVLVQLFLISSKGPTSITIPDVTYTGSSMTLICGPPPENIDLGEIYDSEWKFKALTIRNGGRIEIVTGGNMSMLTINNVILADTGKSKLAECVI